MTHFDHFAEPPSTAIGDWITRRTRRREVAFIQQALAGNDCAILEVGPGRGELAHALVRQGYQNYTAVEPSTSMRKQLADSGITVKGYSIPRLAESDSSYDAIILIDVFEHLHGAHQALLFIDEAWRVLRQGGILCIESPDYLHWKQDFFNCDYSHNNVTSVRRTMQLLHNRGFRQIRYTYLSAFLAGMLATVASYLARLGLFFAGSNGLDRKLYKLKLTFLRRFFIVGAKP